jgi:hypothetical protein
MTEVAQRTSLHRRIIKLVVAIALGLLLSVIPVFPFVFPFLGIPLLIAYLIRVHLYGWRRDVMALLTMCAAITVCAVLPVKALDVKVGPFAYDDMPLAELCQRLDVDWGVHCRVWDPSGKTQRLSFSTPHPLSRRMVLEKLSKETNRPLSILLCGTGATILSGGHPSFTSLGPEDGTAEEEKKVNASKSK